MIVNSHEIDVVKQNMFSLILVVNGWVDGINKKS